MPERALVLAGGGVAGIAWELDVAFSGAEVTLSQILTDLNAAGIVPRIDDAIGFGYGSSRATET